jgi:hypothetical protein
MFWEARPTSNPAAPPTIATTSCAVATLRGAYTHSLSSCRFDSTTTNSQRCLFCELPETRPASRMRCSTSGGIGVSA